MQEICKQKLRLLLSVDGMLSSCEGGVELPQDNWDAMRDALAALGLPADNIMMDIIGQARSGETDALAQLRAYFTRLFDAQASAASHSANISASYEEQTYGADREFMKYLKYIKDNTIEALHAHTYARLAGIQKENPGYYRLLTEDSRGWYFEGNWLDGVNGANNSLIVNRVQTLKENHEKLAWLYDNLADALSRRSLNAFIRFWLTWDFSAWRDVSLYYCDVVDNQIFPFYDDEVFVDCGSYVGDTVLQYIDAVNGSFKRVYTYDIASASIRKIKENLSPYPRVVVRHKGTGEANSQMPMVGVDQAFHGNKLAAGGSAGAIEMVEVVRLDDDIDEPVTFLKVDCEGMDKETLRGARRLIRKYHPKLHVDSYHKLADIVDVPWLIRQIDPSYTLYLRLPMAIDAPPRFPAPAFFAV